MFQLSRKNILKFLLLLMTFSLTRNLAAQNETRIPIKKCAHLEGGFLVEKDQMNKDYHTGGSFHYSYCIKVAKGLGVGGGSAVMIYDQQAFLPIYFNTMYIFGNKRNNPVVGFQAGYSIGWNNRLKNYPKYHSDGGAYFSAETGYKFHFDEQLSAYFAFAYRKQFVAYNYDSPILKNIHEKNNFGMFSIVLGLMLEQN